MVEKIVVVPMVMFAQVAGAVGGKTGCDIYGPLGMDELGYGLLFAPGAENDPEGVPDGLGYPAGAVPGAVPLGRLLLGYGLLFAPGALNEPLGLE